MASIPKTFEALRKALAGLGENVTVSLYVDTYDSLEPVKRWTSEDWHGRVQIKEGDDTLSVQIQEKEPGKLYRRIKAELVVLRKRMREQKRIAHQPKLIEYKERA